MVAGLKYQWDACKVCIYHFLSAAFRQSVADAQVVDLDVLDEVTILLKYVVVHSVRSVAVRWRRGGLGCRGSLAGALSL